MFLNHLLIVFWSYLNKRCTVFPRFPKWGRTARNGDGTVEMREAKNWVECIAEQSSEEKSNEE